MNSINHHDHIIKLCKKSIVEKTLNETASTFKFKKIMHINNACYGLYPLVGWLVGWSIGWLVGQSSGWLVNPLAC